MKKIIYSLLLCFILLFTIPSVRADEEIIYKDGKELVVTNVKAMQPANQVIPDSVGYFEEGNAVYYYYIVGDIKYPVLKSDKFLPSEIFNSSIGLYPTLFEKIYVHNGYWAYEKDNDSYILASQIYSISEDNFFLLDIKLNNLITNFGVLGNTFGYFYLKENHFYYRFYKTYLVDSEYIIDYSISYLAIFDVNYPYLPKNIEYSFYNENIHSFNSLDLTFYCSINSFKWNVVTDTKDIRINHFFEGHVVLENVFASSITKIPVFYFNIKNSKFSDELLDIDYMQYVTYSMIKNDFINDIETLLTDTLYPSSKRKHFIFKWIHSNDFDRIVDCKLEDRNYFYINETFYRFKLMSVGENENINNTFIISSNYEEIKDFFISDCVFTYQGIVYKSINPSQKITIDNGCSIHSVKNNIFKIILLCVIFILVIFLLKFISNIYLLKKKKENN